MQGYGAAELAGVVFGLLYVWLAIRENVWCWPAGLANAALFLVVFFHARLYGAAALQARLPRAVALRLETVAAGRGAARAAPRVAHAAASGRSGSAPSPAWRRSCWRSISSTGPTDALPLSDAATTAASLAAQWMTTRKWLESWLVWIAVNAVYVAMYVSQRLHPTAALYAVFLVMAVLGYREWRASMRAAAA